MNYANVLIISDDPEFARTLAGRWQAQRHVPEITVATSDVWKQGSGPECDLVLVGPVNSDRASVLRAASFAGALPVILLADGEEGAPLFGTPSTNLIVVAKHDGWPETLIVLATEVLRRVDAVGRAQRAERLALVSQRHATLGRYMLEVRPSVNNALTSMLGNADLLLLEKDEFSGNSREQLRAIHTMALRLNEIVQRFSSLAAEMWAGETESQDEMEAAPRHL